jgi:hypothetical protein
MVHTHSRCAPVSVTDNYHRNLLSGDHLHHGLLGRAGLTRLRATRRSDRGNPALRLDQSQVTSFLSLIFRAPTLKDHSGATTISLAEHRTSGLRGRVVVLTATFSGGITSMQTVLPPRALLSRMPSRRVHRSSMKRGSTSAVMRT